MVDCPVLGNRCNGFALPLKRRKKPKSRALAARVIERHKQWVRGFACLVDRCDTGTRIVAAHVRNSDLTPQNQKGGMGLKPVDVWIVPMCWDHHGEQTDVGEAAFCKKYGVDMGKTALELQRKSPALVEWRRDNVE